ncbi:MAG TPA: XisI protein [Candidatus Thiothrix moscowensis]|uniref:XisI protein n=1 Tax=Thiothrix sp. UBA5583 TaxID=1947697 RepID=UPI0025F1D1E3|nr:XisI protein [Thiothrix sp. UBA5583]HRJ52900.1 XisI protein [Candidatus Thiothrix moscowensis]HRJ93450.1 XisI protein [Candidatus Thiothrix moscowensis]
MFGYSVECGGNLSGCAELSYSEIIRKILLEYLKYDSVDDVIKSSVSFDDEHGNYVLLQAGWRGDDYLQGAVIHIQLIDGKIWIQYDGTEEGVATELVDAGIPKSDIVLGFRHPSVRQYTGFALL